MDRFEGTCVGGPYAGKQMVHWARTREFFAPMTLGLPGTRQMVSGVKIGEYKLNNFQQWHWWETPEGKAYRTLSEQGEGN